MAKWAEKVTILVRARIAGRQHVRLPHPPDRRRPEHRGPLPRAGRRRHRHRHRPSRIADTCRTPPPGRGAAVPADALFVLIGAQPRTEWLADTVARDQQGFILTGPDLPAGTGAPLAPRPPPLPLETSLPGVFAAGDVRHGSVKRVASAVGEGAAAIPLVHSYLQTMAAAKAAARKQHTQHTGPGLSRRHGDLAHAHRVQRDRHLTDGGQLSSACVSDYEIRGSRSSVTNYRRPGPSCLVRAVEVVSYVSRTAHPETDGEVLPRVT